MAIVLLALLAVGLQPQPALASVEIVSFEGRWLGEGKVELVWVTANESDIAGFFVLRSTDPNQEGDRTSPYAIPSQNSLVGATYVYTDTSVPDGVYWYNLEAINRNTGERDGPLYPADNNPITVGSPPTLTPTRMPTATTEPPGGAPPTQSGITRTATATRPGATATAQPTAPGATATRPPADTPRPSATTAGAGGQIPPPSATPTTGASVPTVPRPLPTVPPTAYPGQGNGASPGGSPPSNPPGPATTSVATPTAVNGAATGSLPAAPAPNRTVTSPGDPRGGSGPGTGGPQEAGATVTRPALVQKQSERPAVQPQRTETEPGTGGPPGLVLVGLGLLGLLVLGSAGFGVYRWWQTGAGTPRD